jgi:periplasmic divalent cation tolerance protein
VGAFNPRAVPAKRAVGMERAVLVYTTYPSVVEAEKAGEALVGSRLAACVNILPGMVSIYRWQGAVERAEEAVMIVKTRASLAEEVRTGIKVTHPYDTPAIVVLPVESIDERYFAWILAETGASPKSETPAPFPPAPSPSGAKQ